MFLFIVGWDTLGGDLGFGGCGREFACFWCCEFFVCVQIGVFCWVRLVIFGVKVFFF